jgi:cytochrome c-type biogenesis protein CcmH
MAASPPPASRFNPATLALVTAALLVAVALAVRFWPAGAALESDTGNVSTNGAASDRAGDLDALAAQLAEAVRLDPDNHQAWFQLGLLLRNSGRFVEAEQAFRRAGELAPDNPDYLAYRGEILMVVSRGEIPPEAERLFRRALALDRENAQARYFLATIRDRRGEHAGAIDDLIALLRDAPPGAAWEAQVRTAITGIAARNRIDVAGRVPPPRTAPAEATAAIPGPTARQMEAARGMPPAQQDEIVRSMVDRLAARLRQNPRDANGWMMLMRSRMVMQQPDAARDALRSALAAFNGDAATQSRLREAARQLGVPAA